MYTIQYNGETAFSKGIMITKRPSVPTAEEDIKEYDIPGRDGVLIEHVGTVKDIIIPIEMNFITRPHDWTEKKRAVSRWLNDKDDMRLYLGDREDVFYRVKNVTVEGIEREIKQSGAFTANFLCEGYVYTDEGNEWQSIKTFYNDYDVTCPEYIITGEGVCTLTVNGKTIKANVGQNITIDTKRQIAYRTDGTINNTAITGDYDNAMINRGDNTFSVSSGFTLKVKTNERFKA